MRRRECASNAKPLAFACKSWDRTRLSFAALSVSLLALALAAAPASAARIGTASTFGGPANPVGLAVDNSSSSSAGDVYVSDFGSGPSKIIKLDPTGKEIGTVGIGRFANASHLAVDPSNGDLYASDLSAHTISAFDSNGSFLFQIGIGGTPFGVAVDPSKGPNGTLYVADQANGLIDEFDAATGTYIGNFGSGNVIPGAVQSLAVDGSGNVYAANENVNVVEFDSSGACVNSCTPIDTDSPQSVSVDPSNDHIFIGENDPGGFQIAEYASPGAAPIDTFGQGDFPAGARVLGLGVSGEADTVYAADFAHSAGHIYGPAGPTHTLTVSKTGAGTGTVTSSPGGINCGAACSHVFLEGTQVTLTATHPPVGSTFTGWSVSGDPSASCNDTSPCQVTLGADVAVTANFDQVTTHTLTVSMPGSGSGTVTSDKGAINCPGTCSDTYNEGTTVTLSQTPASGSVFKGFSGDCLGATCQLTLSADATVSADFGALLTILSGDPAPVGFFTATLRGTVNPHTTTVSGCHFAYVAAVDYNAAAPNPYSAGPPPAPCVLDNGGGSDLGSGSAPVAVHADISGLDLLNAYHFRLEAVNENGPINGSDKSFETTAATPLIDSTSTAAAVTKYGADLHAQVNPRGAATGYHFDYIDDASWQANVQDGLDSFTGADRAPLADEADLGPALTDQSSSQTLTGLTPGTTYHYRVVATNAISDAADSPVTGPAQTFTTDLGQPPIAATAPATAIGTTTATLAGTVDPNGLPTTYRFEFGTTAAYGTTVSSSAGDGNGALDVSLEMRDLAPATTYHYRVVATSADGTSFGADRTFTTTALPQGAPPPPPQQPAPVTPPHKRKPHKKPHPKKHHHKHGGRR